MQTSIPAALLATTQGKEAENILRTCVHCGFCTATCPTYQLLGNELDSPRGRIYLIKQMLEGNEISGKTQLHLDRCLTCRACETTCPSGVEYGRLVEIGRSYIEERVQRPVASRIQRLILRKIIPYPARFKALLSIGQLIKPILPYNLRNKLPKIHNQLTSVKNPLHERKMLILEGCAQYVVTPDTNAATESILNHLGISVIRNIATGCCGAVSQHLSATDEASNQIKQNIDRWWPHIESGIEAIIMTASGCGAMVKEYGHLLKDDPEYADKAQTVSKLAKDLSEIVCELDIASLPLKKTTRKIAFHAPCTLQHGQQITGVVESILEQAGAKLVNVEDSHLCCGSAGTYSILQAKLSGELLDNKLANLQKDKPDIILTANIGCQMHLATKSGVPVKHWVEYLHSLLS